MAWRVGMRPVGRVSSSRMEEKVWVTRERVRGTDSFLSLAEAGRGAARVTVTVLRDTAAVAVRMDWWRKVRRFELAASLLLLLLLSLLLVACSWLLLVVETETLLLLPFVATNAEHDSKGAQRNRDRMTDSTES